MKNTPAREEALLIELLTEELPPRALPELGAAFAEGLRKELARLELLSPEADTQSFATPRRLAVRFSAVREQAPDQPFAEKLMPVKIGLDAEGKATPALLKRLAGKGLAHLGSADLERQSDGKQDILIARGTSTGATLAAGLQSALDLALDRLPIPKVMQYQLADGITTVRFVRPAHGLVALWGADIVPVQALGLEAGRNTLGHRFMSQGAIELHTAESYEEQLQDARVIPGFDARRRMIADQLEQQARELQTTVGSGAEVEALLDEVTALVEHPTVYVGAFEPRFLEVPPECLILTMRLNQKYFPLFDPADGRLTHHFLIVSNMDVPDPATIIEGNQRVVRPRLADAEFFYRNDRRTPLAERVAALSARVYHNKLGSQLDRVERVRRLARHLAGKLGADADRADRAALLAKADLSTQMVAEFPELQGIMGAYYADADGEDAEVVRALRQQYRTRLDGRVTRDTLVAAILFLAERVETLVGIWGLGLAPTGERDPYGLRRAALGLIDACRQLRAGGFLGEDRPGLDLTELLAFALDGYEGLSLQAGTAAEVRDFIYERYRNQLASSFDRRVVDAVIALQPPLEQVEARTQACARFADMPESASLAAANKRIGNILRKADNPDTSLRPGLLVEPAERRLAERLQGLAPEAEKQRLQGDFEASLATLSTIHDAVDAFFDDVMVMAEDPLLRANRLALLARLHATMNQVADISRLAQ